MKQPSGASGAPTEIDAALPREFFLQDPVTCAWKLIGCELAWDGCAGLIVETEAYSSVNDEACHMFFKPSARSFVERNEAGAAYIYLNYGVHWMANVLCKGREPGFVLIRALQPTRGIEQMRERRCTDKLESLCSGPGKLTKALNILGIQHETDLCMHPERGFRKTLSNGSRPSLIQDVRIGINRAADLPWRFLAAKNPHVSVRPTSAASPFRRRVKG